MLFKKLDILASREFKTILQRFAAGIERKCLVKVHVYESQKTFLYLMESGNRKRLACTDRFCPNCVEPRRDDQIAYSLSVHGDNRDYCRLCGAEIVDLMFVDGPIAVRFGALAQHHTSSINSRLRADIIHFFKGARIFQPIESAMSNELQSA